MGGIRRAGEDRGLSLVPGLHHDCRGRSCAWKRPWPIGQLGCLLDTQPTAAAGPLPFGIAHPVVNSVVNVHRTVTATGASSAGRPRYAGGNRELLPDTCGGVVALTIPFTMDAGESMYPVRLRAQTLMLREFGRDDASGLYKVYGDADATRHLSFEPKDIEQVSAIVKTALTNAVTDPRTEYMLAVADAHSEELVGAAQLALGSTRARRLGLRCGLTCGGRAGAPRRSGCLNVWGLLSWACTGSWVRVARSTRAQPGPCARPGWSRRALSGGHLFTRGAWRDSVVHSILADEYAANGSSACSAASGLG